MAERPARTPRKLRTGSSKFERNIYTSVFDGNTCLHVDTPRRCAAHLCVLLAVKSASDLYQTTLFVWRKELTRIPQADREFNKRTEGHEAFRFRCEAVMRPSPWSGSLPEREEDKVR